MPLPSHARAHVTITEPHEFRQMGLPSAKDISVLSLDIFDTMLVRRSGSPTAHYLWLGRQLYASGSIQCTPETFARLRHAVELDTWKREGGMDSCVTLEMIYAELCRVLALDSEHAASLSRHELLLEERILHATPQAYELLSIAQKNAWRVVFVSDTYFPASFLEQQLQMRSLWPPGAQCFSSSDHSASKARGTLYGIVMNHCSVPPQSILHAGDNPSADVRSAARQGVRPIRLPAGNRNRYEIGLLEAGWSTGGLAASFAGASQLTRMSIGAIDSRERALRDATAGVAAPFLAAYLLWIAKHARKKNIKRLYFLARDGEILNEMAKVIFPKLGLEIEARYLFVSRRAVNLSALYRMSPGAIAWAFRGAVGKPMSRTLERLGLNTESVLSNLGHLATRGFGAQSLLDKESAKALREAVEGGSLSERVLQAARSRREHVLGYLRQEGIFDGEPIGLVDLGGVGSQALALYEHLVSNNGPRAAFYFVNIDNGPSQEASGSLADQRWLNISECFLYNRKKRTGISGFRNLPAAFQMFSAAMHGTVLGYKESNGRIEAVLDGVTNERLRDWGLPLVHKTAITFAENLLLDQKLMDIEGPMRRAVCANIELFLRSPTREEANAWGDFPFEDSGVEANERTAKILAPPFTLSQLAKTMLKAAVTGNWPKPSWRNWDDASSERTSPVLRSSLRLAKQARKLLGRE